MNTCYPPITINKTPTIRQRQKRRNLRQPWIGCSTYGDVVAVIPSGLFVGRETGRVINHNQLHLTIRSITMQYESNCLFGHLTRRNVEFQVLTGARWGN